MQQVVRVRAERRGRASVPTSWVVPLSIGGCIGLVILVASLLSATGFATPAASAEMPTASKKEEDPEETRGSLVIMGGSERFENRVIWSEIVDLAGGAGSRIAVFPTASGSPVQDGEDVVRVLNEAGADAFVVPVGIRGFDTPAAEAVREPQLVESVERSTGVFFVGGEQARLRQMLVTPDGQDSPLLEAVWSVYRQGGVIAGTSAGAAVMSRIMFRSARSVLGTMLNGVTMGKEIDYGFGFMHPDWFVDQHCLVRGRFARALVAMQSQGFRYGVGIDEDTAVVVRGDSARVIGYRGALILDLSEAATDESIAGFNLTNAKLTYLDRGDEINLRTLHVSPSPEKAGDRKVDPRAPDFRPTFRGRLFCNDILGNMAVHDLMLKLLDNRYDEALGLAFDGALATQGDTRGFEFRFFRAEDTFGWETEAFGGDDYTVVNIHLDITPVTIRGPLYTK